MSRNTIRLIIILAISIVLGILIIQFVFLRNTVNLNEIRFHESTTQALKEVARHLIDYNDKVKNRIPKINQEVEVEQISNNYYVVNVNEKFNPSLLEYFLLKEFKKRSIDTDFEYAVYDCESNEMVFGISRIDSTAREKVSSGCITDEDFFEDHTQGLKCNKEKSHLPKCDKYTYYFGVHFIDRSPYYSSSINAWYIINGILIVVILFFGYTLYIIVKQQRLSEIQKNFINNLTHEFKTPISSINLAAKVLADPNIIRQPERMGKYSGIIEEQARRLLFQVEKILNMASIEKKKLQLEVTEIELQSFITKCAEDFLNGQNGDEHHINFHFPDNIITVKADIFHFTNVVFNILDNAFKYCQHPPVIDITIEQKTRHVEISIADNGMGIPKQYRKKIFARFYRIPTGNIHNVKGFGLGLEYVKKVIERQKWKIKVTDNHPQGSVFIIII